MLSSDPHSWLRDYFARLHARHGFGLLAPAHQFDQLVQAVEPEHQSKAAQMREWSVAAQHGLLLHLTSMIEQKESAARVELWSVRKGDLQLTCVAVYLPTGIDLRLFEGTDFRRKQLCKDALEVEALSHKWRSALLDVGWTESISVRSWT